jgi:hypothetical protein
MAAYIPLIIWLIGAFICFYIARARKLKPGLTWRLTIVILGPLAIPLMFIRKPEQNIKADQ